MHKKKIAKRKLNLRIKKGKKKIQVKTNQGINDEEYEEQGIYKNINKEITKALLKNVPQVQKGFNDRLLKNKVLSKKISQIRSDKQKQQEQSQLSGEQQVEVEEMTMEQLQKLLGVQKKEEKDEDFHKKKLNLSLDEKWAMEKIYKKYKTNFSKAYLDNKVNTFCWNENQMQKKYDAYEFKYGDIAKELQKSQ
ncbi:hypothetical protein PPERSA_11492 [Pseudocohnilembus persalinus]|uniref:Nucleolar protein 16 n=1 Tax=Pseudocohnilembus persalinus TaxID=266149 RepID=A0A0V0QX00_PSEPJ|nr:hypothetical protein PPERSA_11492 [Pseudocohnilembus persalinus]|eukprot:KRX06847.1 hypothetical protein PPERSA_11492 [Pseudocohnilembus persalinus]